MNRKLKYEDKASQYPYNYIQRYNLTLYILSEPLYSHIVWAPPLPGPIFTSLPPSLNIIMFKTLPFCHHTRVCDSDVLKSFCQWAVLLYQDFLTIWCYPKFHLVIIHSIIMFSSSNYRTTLQNYCTNDTDLNKTTVPITLNSTIQLFQWWWSQQNYCSNNGYFNNTTVSTMLISTKLLFQWCWDFNNSTVPMMLTSIVHYVPQHHYHLICTDANF